jgi:hypothetical protein
LIPSTSSTSGEISACSCNAAAASLPELRLLVGASALSMNSRRRPSTTVVSFSQSRSIAVASPPAPHDQ